MPIEIKELVIRAVAEPGGAEATTAPSAEQLNGGQDAIVQACVREVLRIVKQAKER